MSSTYLAPAAFLVVPATTTHTQTHSHHPQLLARPKVKTMILVDAICMVSCQCSSWLLFSLPSDSVNGLDSGHTVGSQQDISAA